MSSLASAYNLSTACSVVSSFGVEPHDGLAFLGVLVALAAAALAAAAGVAWGAGRVDPMSALRSE